MVIVRGGGDRVAVRRDGDAGHDRRPLVFAGAALDDARRVDRGRLGRDAHVVADSHEQMQPTTPSAALVAK